MLRLQQLPDECVQVPLRAAAAAAPIHRVDAPMRAVVARCTVAAADVSATAAAAVRTATSIAEHCVEPATAGALVARRGRGATRP